MSIPPHVLSKLRVTVFLNICTNAFENEMKRALTDKVRYSSVQYF